MFKNIKKTLLLNRQNFDHIEGTRFYYSSQITWLTFIVLIIFLGLYLYYFITDPDPEFKLFWIVALFLFMIPLIRMFHKFIFKNPIFIINKNHLFYTKKEKWYNLMECKVAEVMIDRSNFSGSLSVKCKEETDSFLENYWYIEYDSDLKKIIKNYITK